jgi:hypothetical protein
MKDGIGIKGFINRISTRPVIRRIFYLDILRMALKEKKLVLYMLIMDIVAFFVIVKLIPVIDMFFYEMKMLNMLVYMVIMYLLIVPFVYSLFKYCVLDFTRSIIRRDSFSFRRLPVFWRLNFRLLVVPFLFSMTVLFLIALVVRREYAGMLFGLIMLPVMFAYYPFIQIAHARFYLGKSVRGRDIAKSVFRWRVFSPYLTAVIVLAVVSLSTLMISPVITYALYHSQAIYDILYMPFQNAYNMGIMAVILLLHSLNRIFFLKEVSIDVCDKVA